MESNNGWSLDIFFKKNLVKVNGYADDVLLYVVEKIPPTLADRMQPAFDRVLLWGLVNGLSFYPAKPSTVLFMRNRQNLKNPRLVPNGKALEVSDSFKYLGGVRKSP